MDNSLSRYLAGDELKKVEARVDRMVRDAKAIQEIREISISEACELAMANSIFGEPIRAEVRRRAGV